MAFEVSKKKEEAHEDGIWSVFWKGEKGIFTSGADALIKKWNLDLKEEQIFSGHTLGITSMDVSRSGTIFSSSSLDSTIKIWNFDDPNPQLNLEAGPCENWSIAFSPDEKFIVSSGQSGSLTLWKTENGQKEQVLSRDGKFTMSLTFSPNGKYIASGAQDGVVTIFDFNEGKLLHSVQAHAKAIRSLKFTADSNRLITASDDLNIKIHDMNKINSNPITLSGHSSWVLSLACNPNEKFIASGSSDKKVKIWEIGTNQCVHTFADHDDQVWGLYFNEKGDQLVSVGDDKKLIIYKTP